MSKGDPNQVLGKRDKLWPREGRISPEKRIYEVNYFLK